jgi:hypothetical protein
MFPWSTPSPLTRHTRNALSLARSFLLLEDDYVRDWEVAGTEPGQRDARGWAQTHDAGNELSRRDVVDTRGASGLHPHQTPLRGRSARERAGQPPPAGQVCLCPLRHGRRTVKPASTHTGRPQTARM